MKENRKLLREVLKDIRHDMTDEEVLNLLADSKISENPAGEQEKYTLGQRAADAIAKFAGSWAFIFSFTGVLILWMLVNTLLAAKAFDPSPLILLNLVISCVAAIQAPLIMMSQNRQEEKDRRRAENDYKVNLKTEIMIEDLYDKVNAILARQTALEKQLTEKGESAGQKMREDRAVLPHFLLFLRNAESSSANLRAFVEMPLRRVKPLYVQDSMLLYSWKCFLSSWFSPSTSSVISASSTVSGEMFTSVLPFRFTPRMLTPYFLRMSSSPMLRPCQSSGTATSIMACCSSSSM